jgi:hypothetical protein
MSYERVGSHHRIEVGIFKKLASSKCFCLRSSALSKSSHRGKSSFLWLSILWAHGNDFRVFSSKSLC